MRLQEFLDCTSISTLELANKSGVTVRTIQYVLKGHDIKLSTAAAIQDATFNKVTCIELLPQQNCKDLKKNKRKHNNRDDLEKHS
jgi:predicted transcriptional regulator